MVDEVEIYWDADGCHLRLVGDLTAEAERYRADADADGLTVRLSQDATIQLAAQSRAQIAGWVAEMDAARLLYDATRRDGDGSFEGVGDFDGDAAERYAAHQAAKGRS